MNPAEAHWSVGVVIPARNEEATIDECVRSILEAAAFCGHRHSLWIVVVADACVDKTADIARRAIGSFGQVLERTARSAGAARGMGAAATLAHFDYADSTRIWLANTDGDTRVPRDWLRVHLELANRGVTAVAGIVQLDPNAPDNGKAGDIYRRTYRLHGDGTHPHVHGANIAVRGDAYLDVGGWSNRRLAEDHCLWERICAKGWQVQSPVSSVVLTSPRFVGRVRGGFADTLRALVNARHESV